MDNVKTQQNEASRLRTGGSADLAFAIVVLSSYFAMFSTLQDTNVAKIIIMVLLGVAYITLGIYGYSFCQRRQYFNLTLLYFLVQVIIGSSIVFLGEGLGFSAILLLPLASQAVVMFSSFWLYVINGTILIGYLIAVRFHSGNLSDIWNSLPTIIAGLIYVMIFTQMALDEERTRQKAERLYDELQTANKKLVKYASEIEELATIQERNRLAREIHDGLGHYLTTILIQLQAAEALLPSDKNKALKAIEKASGQTRLALLDVRKSVTAFREETFSFEDLDSMIRKALEPCEWVGIQADYVIVGEPRPVSYIMQTTIFRIVQETVNNTCKYSAANLYQVVIDYSLENKIRIQIKDDGVGAEAIQGGYGLIGLRERIDLLNGTVRIDTSPNEGFALEIKLPYG